MQVGGAVVADNMIEAGPGFADVRALLAGEDINASATSRGIAAYLNASAATRRSRPGCYRR